MKNFDCLIDIWCPFADDGDCCVNCAAMHHRDDGKTEVYECRLTGLRLMDAGDGEIRRVD